ncbi:MAG: entericidin [Campylobacter sp.]|nr:entericidin [Campylobacter sp.]
MKCVLAFIVIAILLTGLIGCNTAKGIKKDINQGAGYIEKNTR